MKKIFGSILLVVGVLSIIGCAPSTLQPPSSQMEEEQVAAPARPSGPAKFAAPLPEVPFAALQQVKIHCVKTSESAQQKKEWVEKHQRAGRWCRDETVGIIVTDETGKQGKGQVHIVGGVGKFEIPNPLRGDITVVVTPKVGAPVSLHLARRVQISNIAVAIR